MPSTKRPGEEDADGNLRKKFAGAPRTGQACDRCKLRKIRCDARPGGCSPCLQNNSECKTTDRITGRATSRGHTENLESENASLKLYMVELQQQLRERGVEPKPPPNVPQGYIPAQSYWGPDEQRASWGDLNSSGVNPSSGQDDRHGSQGAILPDFRSGLIGDNYLGVSSNNDWLSPIEGTTLTLFGYKIDLADFLPPALPDPAQDPWSYQTFITHAFRSSQPAREPPLPNYQACTLLADWYFKSVQCFTPFLHKPHFAKLMSRIHHGHYVPNVAESVMVHMVLATINFHIALRNSDEKARTESVVHYHYSLSRVPELIAGHKLEDIQALGLICAQLRNQPRLGAAWMFTNMVVSLAMEIGLHRSATAWQGDAAERDPHVIEMRKRVFWSLLTTHSMISGKLGRPMPLRLEDVDIEAPEPVLDNLPGEAHQSAWRKCSFRPAVAAHKLVKITMRTYSVIYSVRGTNEPYEVSVQNLERELQDFRAQLPPELSGGPQTVDQDRMPAAWIQTSENEARLLIHHPSLCRSSSPQVQAKNLDVCLEASRNILASTTQLREIKGMDSTWYFTMTLLAAIFTTLFAHTQRQDQITATDLQRLRQDMDAWLDIMADVGILLGSGARLREAMRAIIDTSLTAFSRHLAAKTASAGLASAESPTQRTTRQPQHQHQHQQGHFLNAGEYPNGPYSNGIAPTDMADRPPHAYAAMDHRASEPLHQQNHYPSGEHFYPDPGVHGSIRSYSAGHISSYNASDYTPEDMKPNMEPQLNTQHPMPPPPQQVPTHQQQASQHAHPLPPAAHMPPAHSQQTPTNFMATLHAPPSATSNGHHPAHFNGLQPSGPAAWRNFTDTMGMSMPGPDYLNSANALMALGDDKAHGPMDVTAGTPANMGGMQMAPSGQIPWPLSQYHEPNGTGT